MVVARRDRPGKEGKTFGVSWEAGALVAHVEELMADIQTQMLTDATAFRDSNIEDVTSEEEFKAAIAEGKWVRCAWDGSDEDEKRLKEETGATLRCFPLEQPPADERGACIVTGAAGAETAIFAKVRRVSGPGPLKARLFQLDACMRCLLCASRERPPSYVAPRCKSNADRTGRAATHSARPENRRTEAGRKNLEGGCPFTCVLLSA